MDYFTHCDTAGIHDLFEGEQEVHRKGYLTDLIHRAGRLVHRAQAESEPFLLSLHYNAPHWPWETRADAAESKRIEQDLPLRRRLGGDLPHHDPPDGRGHRPDSFGVEES